MCNGADGELVFVPPIDADENGLGQSYNFSMRKPTV